MILNGYDTSVGTRFRIKDKVAETIKMLQSTDRLELVDNNGIYAITQANDLGLPPVIYPISIQNYLKEKVTVIDHRPYFNKNNQNVNIPEYNLMFLAAMLQQDAYKGNTTLIRTVRPFTIKAFANSIARKLEGALQLDIEQKTTLRILLAYYYVCLIESPDVDYTFIAQNSIQQALKFPGMRVRRVIEDLGYVSTIQELLNIIREHPELLPLNRLDLSGLIQAASGIFFANSGFKQIVPAALEMPTLFTAICYAAATQRLYQNTAVGQELDPKSNQQVGSFIKTVGFYLNIQ